MPLARRSSKTLERMQVIYWVLALLLLMPSSLLGMFFLATAGLAASSPAMSWAWGIWLVGVGASGGGVGFAVRRGKVGLILGLCCMPVILALGVVQLTLWFSR